jgi:hypothetical protein
MTRQRLPHGTQQRLATSDGHLGATERDQFRSNLEDPRIAKFTRAALSGPILAMDAAKVALARDLPDALFGHAQSVEQWMS